MTLELIMYWRDVAFQMGLMSFCVVMVLIFSCICFVAAVRAFKIIRLAIFTKGVYEQEHEKQEREKEERK